MRYTNARGWETAQVVPKPQDHTTKRENYRKKLYVKLPRAEIPDYTSLETPTCRQFQQSSLKGKVEIDIPHDGTLGVEFFCPIYQAMF